LFFAACFFFVSVRLFLFSDRLVGPHEKNSVGFGWVCLVFFSTGGARAPRIVFFCFAFSVSFRVSCVSFSRFFALGFVRSFVCLFVCLFWLVVVVPLVRMFAALRAEVVADASQLATSCDDRERPSRAHPEKPMIPHTHIIIIIIINNIIIIINNHLRSAAAAAAASAASAASSAATSATAAVFGCCFFFSSQF